MKSFKLSLRSIVTLMALTIGFINATAQFDVGTDLVSNYVWRGSKYGTGPAVQPWVSYSVGNLEIGSWGSVAVTDNEYAEMDLYLSYGFDFGLSVGLTDYFYPGTPYLDYSSPAGSHGFEVNLGYELGSLSIGANYMLNEAAGAGTAGSDMYFELGYGFETFDVFVGAGDGWHTSDGGFAVCNVGLSTSKEIPITESFSLPISGAVMMNPESEQFHIVVGVSF